MASTLGSKKPKYAKVLKTEEKGSDVNLAANLVNNAHIGAFEAAIVLTNDSDLIEPIKLVTQEVGLPIGVLNPCKQPAGGLKAASIFYTVMRPNAPSKCQFNIQLKDGWVPMGARAGILAFLSVPERDRTALFSQPPAARQSKCVILSALAPHHPQRSYFAPGCEVVVRGTLSISLTERDSPQYDPGRTSTDPD